MVGTATISAAKRYFPRLQWRMDAFGLAAGAITAGAIAATSPYYGPYGYYGPPAAYYSPGPYAYYGGPAYYHRYRHWHHW